MVRSKRKKKVNPFKLICARIKSYFVNYKPDLITGIICTVVGGLIVGVVMNHINNSKTYSSDNRNDITGIVKTENAYYFSMPVLDFIDILKENDASDFQYGYKANGTTKLVISAEDLSMIPQTSYKFIQSYSIITGYIGESPTVVVPEFVNETQIEVIGDEAFYGNSLTASQTLKLIVLCEGIKSIGDKAFAFNYDLQYVVIPSTVTKINETAFDDCPNVVLLLENNSYALNYCKLHNLQYIEI